MPGKGVPILEHSAARPSARALSQKWERQLKFPSCLATLRRCGWGAAPGYIATILSVAVCAAAVASTRQHLTVDKFAERFATPALAAVQLPPFDCKPDARNPSAIVCMNNPRYGGVGANIVLKATRATGDVVYVGVAVANPQLHVEPNSTLLAGFYILLTSQVMRVLTPDIGPDRAMKILTALQENARAIPNEVRVNDWTYGAGTGVVLVFAAERK